MSEVQASGLGGTLGCLIQHKDSALALADLVGQGIPHVQALASCFAAPQVSIQSVDDLESQFTAQGLLDGADGHRIAGLLKFLRENGPAFLELIKLWSQLSK